MWAGEGPEGEGDNPQIDSVLNTEPDMELHLRTNEIMTWDEIISQESEV